MEEGLLQRKQEEEMVGETLQGRWARNNKNTHEITIDTSGSSMPSKPANGTGYLNVGGEDKGLPESTDIYYDTAKGTERNTVDVAVKTYNVQRSLSPGINREDGESWKNEISPDSNVPPSENSYPEEIILDLERLVEKPATHDFYCPHCNSCIKTVILHKTKEESDKITCASCLKAFLIPIELLTELLHSYFTRDKKVEGDADYGPGPAPITGIIPGPGVTAEAPEQKGIVSGPGVTVEVPEQKGPSPTPGIVPSPGVTVEISEEAGPSPTPGIVPSPGVTVEISEEAGPPTPGIVPVPGVAVEVPEQKGIVPDPSVIVEVPEETGPSITGIVPGLGVTEETSEQTGPPITGIVSVPAVTVEISKETGAKQWDILKCIVYGGLIESITSLSVVISAASADATTLNIFALGLANLIGGLFIIGHNLWELKNERSGVASNQTNELVDRYEERLGHRGNFLLHATVAVLSFLVFGLVPLVTYGFSFYKSNNRDYKVGAVVIASVLCIAILAIGKAYIQKEPKFSSYMKTVLYYVTTALAASGVSYIVGDLVKKALEKLGWFESSASVTLPILEITMGKPAWGRIDVSRDLNTKVAMVVAWNNVNSAAT